MITKPPYIRLINPTAQQVYDVAAEYILSCLDKNLETTYVHRKKNLASLIGVFIHPDHPACKTAMDIMYLVEKYEDLPRWMNRHKHILELMDVCYIHAYNVEDTIKFLKDTAKEFNLQDTILDKPSLQPDSE